MTAEEAIEIKLQWRKDNYPPALADEMNADMLSIEALKRHQNRAHITFAGMMEPLPGETEH